MDHVHCVKSHRTTLIHFTVRHILMFNIISLFVIPSIYHMHIKYSENKSIKFISFSKGSIKEMNF
jgi:hypothetical protein